MIMRHRSRDAFFTPTLRQTTPLGEDTLNFQQKVARQFDGNVVFSRYLATIFAAFVRGRHNAAILADSSRQSSEYRQSRMSPIAGSPGTGRSHDQLERSANDGEPACRMKAAARSMNTVRNAIGRQVSI